MWSTAVSAAFTPLIQTLEISLRNSLNESLSIHYGNDWFAIWVTNMANDLRTRRKLVGQSTGERLIKKAQEKIIKRDNAESIRKGNGPLASNYIPGWQSVLAELTFGFWTNFLVRWYWDVNHHSRLWPNHIIDVFPGSPSNMHSVSALHNSFERAVDLRNRIHHQEPLWKNYGVTNIDDGIQYLLSSLAQCLNQLDYIGRGQTIALQRYGVISAIEEICTKEAFYRFIGRNHGQFIPLHTAKRSLPLLKKNLKDHQCIWVVSKELKPQLILRSANRKFF